jgi:riboflavin kinase
MHLDVLLSRGGSQHYLRSQGLKKVSRQREVMAEAKYLPLLLLLLKKGAHARPVKDSTGGLASELGVSQQSVSRWIIELGKAGKITRSSAGIALSRKTVEEFRRIHAVLASAFQPLHALALRGKLFTGLGEGGYYISKPAYSKQFKGKLGFVPFAGTLNIRLKDAASRAPLDLQQGIRVEGFSASGRFYGGLTAYKAVINGKVRGALVVPDRTHYGKDVLELIAPVDLRKGLKLKDGDTVEVRLEF